MQGMKQNSFQPIHRNKCNVFYWVLEKENQPVVLKIWMGVFINGNDSTFWNLRTLKTLTQESEEYIFPFDPMIQVFCLLLGLERWNHICLVRKKGLRFEMERFSTLLGIYTLARFWFEDWIFFQLVLNDTCDALRLEKTTLNFSYWENWISLSRWSKITCFYLEFWDYKTFGVKIELQHFSLDPHVASLRCSFENWTKISCNWKRWVIDIEQKQK